MEKQDSKTSTDILYSCYAEKSREGESFVPRHVFSHVISGSSEVHLGGKTYNFNEGDFRFSHKNQLSRYAKFPPFGGEYRSISVYLDDEILKSLYDEMNIQITPDRAAENNFLLKPNPLLKNYVASLKPYMDGKGDFNKAVTTLKVKELGMILLETNPLLKNVLFDFSAPGKIDLEAYMNEHYRYNVDLTQFAYLTGRSLAGFKRDFDKIFGISPNRWLQMKRLNDAYYLIKEKGWKTSDVYMEVGFKDFSHFSFAFKKAYGTSPSRVI